MDNKQKNDDTLNEILENDRASSKQKKNKGCFIRFLLIVAILALFFFGFLYVTQYLADLEAEARVRAILTVNARPEITETFVESTDEAAGKIMPSVTATPDTELERTATIAAELTSVAEFQTTENATQQ